MFTTGVSGISHLIHRNIEWPLFFRLLVPGLIGGVTGAYVLSSLHGELVKPFVLAYLAAIGVWLLVRGLVYPPKIRKPTFIAPLGLVGGFLDARSEEHTSELQSLMRISYAVFCLKKKK